MNLSLSTIATGTAAVAMAIASWFAGNEANLAARVDTLATQQAATAQQASDIDARLTRIEAKIDSLSSNGIAKN